MELYNFNVITCNLDPKQSMSFIINFYRWVVNRNKGESVIFDFSSDINTVFTNSNVNPPVQIIESYKRLKIIPNTLPIEEIILADGSQIHLLSAEISNDLYGIESIDFINQIFAKPWNDRFCRGPNIVNINNTKFHIMNSWELRILSKLDHKNIILLDSSNPAYETVLYIRRLESEKINQNFKYLDFADMPWYEKNDTSDYPNYLYFPKFQLGNKKDNKQYSLIDFKKSGKIIERINQIFTYLWFF